MNSVIYLYQKKPEPCKISPVHVSTQVLPPLELGSPFEG